MVYIFTPVCWCQVVWALFCANTHYRQTPKCTTHTHTHNNRIFWPNPFAWTLYLHSLFHIPFPLFAPFFHRFAWSCLLRPIYPFTHPLPSMGLIWGALPFSCTHNLSLFAWSKLLSLIFLTIFMLKIC